MGRYSVVGTLSRGYGINYWKVVDLYSDWLALQLTMYNVADAILYWVWGQGCDACAQERIPLAVRAIIIMRSCACNSIGILRI